MNRSLFGVASALAILVSVSPSMSQAQRPGGGQRGIDSSRYVRTSAPTDPVIQQMWTAGMENGQAMSLAQVLLDSIGPRLTNTDRFDAGQNWLVGKYAEWGIAAEREQYGTWVKWHRGPTYLDLVQPRVRTLEATILGWSPGTEGKWIEAEAVIIPPKTTPEAFAAWLPSVRGKFLLSSPQNPSCRSPEQMSEFATRETFVRDSTDRRIWAADYADRTLQGGNRFEWPADAGVAAVLTTNWSRYPGINKVFGSPKQQVPTLDISCEDYGLLYRLAENGQGPVVRFYAQAENLGEQPVHNVIATIPGSEKPNEYIVFSAHYDSWDGASGATDNGTGTIVMLEAARILKEVYPNPKRTIIIGHWGGEEQGLNGSRAWVEDNPEIVARVHAGFNQDNGTGRVVSIGPGPFPAGVDALVRYMSAIPASMTGGIRMSDVGNPSLGGTDNAAFQCLKSPVYGLGALGWDYGNTTWHTNRDTYDKLIAEDLQNNATLVAMLAYMADQDPELLSHEVGPYRGRDGTPAEWPSCPVADRNTESSPR